MKLDASHTVRHVRPASAVSPVSPVSPTLTFAVQLLGKSRLFSQRKLFNLKVNVAVLLFIVLHRALSPLAVLSKHPRSVKRGKGCLNPLSGVCMVIVCLIMGLNWTSHWRQDGLDKVNTGRKS